MARGEGGPQEPSYYPAPTTFTGLVANSLRLYRLAPRTLILTFLTLGIFEAALRFSSAAIADAVSSESLDLAFGLVIPVVILPVTSGSLGVAIAGVVMADRLAGKATTAREVLRSGFPMREVLASGLFASIIALILAVVLAPIILLTLVMFFGPPVVVHVIALEHDGLHPALSRARAMSRGNLGRLVGILFAVALGTGLLHFMLIQVGFGLINPLEGAQRAIVFGFSIVVQAVLYPYVAAAGLIAYLDVRARSEGFGADELRAERS